MQQRYEILIKEWELVEAKILKFDGIVFSIRGWAVSVFSACLIFAAKDNEPSIMIFCILPLLIFWLIEALHKATQRKFIDRRQVIENYLQSSNFDDDVINGKITGIVSPNIGAAFGRRDKISRLNEVLKSGKILNVWTTYVCMIVVALGAYLFLSGH